MKTLFSLSRKLPAVSLPRSARNSRSRLMLPPTRPTPPRTLPLHTVKDQTINGQCPPACPGDARRQTLLLPIYGSAPLPS
jgi:hypothetical protein